LEHGLGVTIVLPRLWRNGVHSFLTFSFPLASGSLSGRRVFNLTGEKSMQTHNLGYPRIGDRRELKRACEQYWSGEIGADALVETGKTLRRRNWLLQRDAGIDLIPCNDFSFYDQMLDMSWCLGAVPARYAPLMEDARISALDLYFALARGYQEEGFDVVPLEMTKWFDTNYHYLVPEFTRNHSFRLDSTKPLDHFLEAKALGIEAKPVLIGPVSYLLLGKEKTEGFHRLDLLDPLLVPYLELLRDLHKHGAHIVQIDEPFLAMDLDERTKQAFLSAYRQIAEGVKSLKVLLATYFESLGENTELATHLPVHALHLDLARAPAQLERVLAKIPPSLTLSLGLVDGRNIWKNDFQASLELVETAIRRLGSDRVMLAPSCSLLHTPCDLDAEPDSSVLTPEIKRWMAFAKQKLDEVVTLARLTDPATHKAHARKLLENIEAIETRRQSKHLHKPGVEKRLAVLRTSDLLRNSPYATRTAAQRNALRLPKFPTTTIGSFPQTAEIRHLRASLKAGAITQKRYEERLKREIQDAIRWQEEAGLDVLVHGEFERNDMVQYFGEQLAGIATTENGWVQSYGSRCVRPPVIYGDVERLAPITLHWTQYAKSLTTKPVKGMLTGPVTILQWSFVRDDQPREDTAMQIALAIRDEVADLERGGIRLIQIDEPAIREGLPLRQSGQASYLDWAVRAFRLASSGVSDETQIHTHMCYSNFNGIIAEVAQMDADVITIETSRSQMKLLEAFSSFKYPNEVGPGVYDIHSPRIPRVEELVLLLQKATTVIPPDRLWVNPDCGLKTRGWKEIREALANMVRAAQRMREATVAQ
jgi:5-methyltetrahydropteroyltriglutamate--homocysteine methyltransferase